MQNFRALALAASVLAAACATTDALGTYEAILPAADAGERHVRITLNPDGAAALSSAFSGRPNRFLAEGSWKREGNRITVDFNDQKRIVLELAGDQLKTREWDRVAWGDQGPSVLFRVDR